uniref:J domain-containing protein n=1 Tax=Rhodosorus marinus TaxID=101924 RepID=A0A7S0BRH4_9RHOD|mmetsp:Transcript_4533/g.6300  ORF Transcript_4533/g.6300 Transcript_4533/m.6300 type:complete len:492 (+) Transcript_4533:332-1807(+)
MAFTLGLAFTSGLGSGCSSRRPVGSYVCERRQRKLWMSAREDLYATLGVGNGADASYKEIRNAYLKLARDFHPDSVDGGVQTVQEIEKFDAITKAYNVLTDDALRRIYDKLGFEGLEAREALMAQKAKKFMFEGMDPQEMEVMMSDAAFISGAFESRSDFGDKFEYDPDAHEDYCPRSKEEAIYNLKNHEEVAARYFAAWWVRRFSVYEAEQPLVESLLTRNMRTEEMYGLRKRTVMALGKVAQVRPVKEATMRALGECIQEDDFFLRENAVYSLGLIAERNRGPEGIPQYILDIIKEKIVKSASCLQKIDEKEASQTDSFDFDHLEPEVAEKLKAIIRARKETLVSDVDGYKYGDNASEPLPTLILAANNLKLYELVEEVRACLEHPKALVRATSTLFMYSCTGEQHYAESLFSTLASDGTGSISSDIYVALRCGDVGESAIGLLLGCDFITASIRLLAFARIYDQTQERGISPELKTELLSAIDAVITR